MTSDHVPAQARRAEDPDRPLDGAPSGETLAQASYGLAAVIAGLNDGILVEDENRRVVLANPAFCRMFGVEGGPQSLIGADCRLMVEQAKEAFVDPDGFADAVESILESGTPVQGDELRTREGRVLLRDFVPVSMEGQRHGHVWQYRDVTAARASTALNQAGVETSLDAMVTIDHEGRFLEFNPAAERIFGFSQADVLGQSMRDLIIPHRHREAHSAGWNRYMATGAMHVLGQRRLELSALRSDGSEFPIELAVTRVPELQPPVFIGFIRDITQDKAREDRLTTAKEAAERASHAKSEFLSVMSHEIRTPMNAILGLTQLALDSRDDAQRGEFLDSVKVNAEALMSVIDDILDFSKAEAGHMAVRQEIFSVADVVESVTEAVSVGAFERGLELSSSVPPSVDVLVEGDPNRLRQVLLNLLSNAVKFTEDGYVALEVGEIRREGTRTLIRFAVRDSGIGMSSDTLGRIFEPFFQEDSSLSRRFGGMGLGLGISRSLVELMGGRIWGESELNRGSTFRFELPFELAAHAVTGATTVLPKDGRYEVLMLTPSEAVADGLSNACTRLGVPCHSLYPEDLAVRLAQADLGRNRLIVADETLGRSVLEHVADSCRVAGQGTKLQLCILSAPGRRPLDPPDWLGPVVQISKPIKRGKLEAVFAAWQGTPERDAERVMADTARAGTAGRVLVVEDNPTNLAYTSQVLVRAGYSVDEAVDGLEGLRCALANTYDVIVADVQMPAMDGFEMAEAIIEFQAAEAPPILAFSAHVMEGFAERCEAVGMVGYLAKPAKPSELRAAVARAIREARTILIADDSPESREIISRFLGTDFGGVETVSGGVAAVERVRRGGVDLVLLDMNMPDLDGYETARRIRSLHKGGHLPILGMSSWTGAEEERRCLDAGCSGFMEKPIRKEQLEETVGALLEPPTKRREQADPSYEVVQVDPAVADLVPQYLEERRNDVTLLRERLEQANLEAVRTLAHNLAGSGTAYGFRQLTRLGRTLESVASKSDREQVIPWVDELEAYLESVRWEVGLDGS